MRPHQLFVVASLQDANMSLLLRRFLPSDAFLTECNGGQGLTALPEARSLKPEVGGQGLTALPIRRK